MSLEFTPRPGDPVSIVTDTAPRTSLPVVRTTDGPS